MRRGRGSRAGIGSWLDFSGVVVHCAEPIQINEDGLVFGFAVVGDELVNSIEVGKDATTGFTEGGDPHGFPTVQGGAQEAACNVGLNEEAGHD